MESSGSCEHDNEPSGSIRRWKVLYELGNCWIFKDKSMGLITAVYVDSDYLTAVTTEVTICWDLIRPVWYNRIKVSEGITASMFRAAWGWRQQIAPKHWNLPSRLNGARARQSVLFLRWNGCRRMWEVRLTADSRFEWRALMLTGHSVLLFLEPPSDSVWFWAERTGPR